MHFFATLSQIRSVSLFLKILILPHPPCFTIISVLISRHLFSLPFTLRLTAFVMRVFCKAQQFDGVTIDENLICESVGWLIQNQRVDGALPEVHAVIHGEMVVRNATKFNRGIDENIPEEFDYCSTAVKRKKTKNKTTTTHTHTQKKTTTAKKKKKKNRKVL